ncbi:MAG: DMT family transporter [Thermaerobacter sp.]|nr:DMT family transporter [Thermaerobacter sp.]
MPTAQAILYTILWASAAVATKIGLRAAPPLILASVRFSLAGLLLLGFGAVRGWPLVPPRDEWTAIGILGALNTTVYLGATFLALQVVSAGLFNLFVAINPLVVLILEQVWLKHALSPHQWWGLGVSVAGLAIGSWQAVTASHAPLWGIVLVVGGQIAMAVGSVYFQVARVSVSGPVLNTWQLLVGSVLLWPGALALESPRAVVLNGAWWGSLSWLVLGVSIGAMLLWFHLLRIGASQASLWLMLTPVVGYGLGWIVLREPIGIRGAVASLVVIAGVGIATGYGQRRRRRMLAS